MKEEKKRVNTFDEVIKKELFKKAENELDIRNSELEVKRLNAYTNYRKQLADEERLSMERERLIIESERVKIERERLMMEREQLTMESRRLSLDEIQVKYNITADMVRKSEKIQRAIGKTMVGLFPEQDKQVVKILESAKKLAEFQE